MANIFYAGEKAEKAEASRRLIEAVSAIYDGEFGVVFQMDDGGSHLTLLLEVESPHLQLEEQMENMLLLVPIFGIVGLIYMFVLRNWVVKQDSGSEKMTKLAAYIKEGALAFLNAEYRILAIFVVVAGALLGIVSSIVETTHWFIVVAFVIGAVCSAVA